MRLSIISAMVDAFLPSKPELSGDDQFRIVNTATDLVKDRINIMAFPFRFAITILIFSVEALAFVFLFGSFYRADRERRCQYLDRIESLPVLPLDDLIRLVRSLTLLTYYDDPIVRQHIGVNG